MTQAPPHHGPSPRARGAVWLAFALLILITTLWLTMRPPASPPAPPLASLPPAPALAVEPVGQLVSPLQAPSAAAPNAPVAAASNCAHQHLDLQGRQGMERACVSATLVQQNGSVRSHRLQAEGTSAWSLRVDLAGDTLVAIWLHRAAVGSTPARWFSCEAKACGVDGLRAPEGRDDATLSLVNTRLLPVATGHPADAPADAREAILLTATLHTPRGRGPSAPPCPGGALSVLDGRRAAYEFCPQGGAGFELADDDTPRFHFRDLAGQRLMVHLATDGSVLRVQLGTLACEAPACAGVSVAASDDAADLSAERRFAFAGTTLRDPAVAGRTALLNGEVTLPGQP